MIELSKEEQKGFQMGILRHIEKICSENNLKYFLDSGTLIGAVRHSGYIPWDDDIDIIMFREDYEKLITALNTSSRYRAIDFRIVDNYAQSFAKVIDTVTILKHENTIDPVEMGVYIDIFPIDNVPDSKIKRFIFFNCIWYLRSLLHGAARLAPPESFSWGKKFLWRLTKKIDLKSYNSLINKMANKYNDKQTKNVTSIVPSSQKYLILEREWFSIEERVIFEDDYYPIPCGYDNYLKILYGNYMELPPENERVFPHTTKVYRRDDKEL